MTIEPQDQPTAAVPENDPGAAWWGSQQQAPAQQAPAPTPPAPQAPVQPPAPPAGTVDDDGVAVEDDFDAWLAQYATRQPKARIYGVVIPIPFDIPLKITQQVENSGDLDVAVMRDLVRKIHGEDIERTWWDRGVGSFGLGVILAWTVMRARGERVSFGEAVEKATALGEKAAAEKSQRDQVNARLSAAAAAGTGDSPEARAERAALEVMADAGKAPWSGTGAPSSPTSGGSTASPLQGSPT